MPKTLIQFAEQSLYVGIGLTCRVFTDFWHSTARKKEITPNYIRGVEDHVWPQRKG